MEESVLLCSSFSSDGKYLACGYSNGFAVYQCEKVRKLFFRKFITGGIGLIEMVESSNLFLLVGGGMRPLFSPSQVMIWDDAQARFVGEITVGSKVLNLRVTKKLFVVVTINNVYMYNRDTLKKVSEYSTVENSLGVIASNSECIVIPGQERGSLTVISHEGGIVHLKAHSNYLQSVYLADRGSLIATASEKGTLIRLFDIEDGRKCQEFRRGYDKAAISLLCVSQDQKYMMCAIDRTIISIFEISESEKTMEG
ncbi:autophagy-related protein 18A-like protein [Blastocystis sp. subtype 4]|uniref:autophagy-related protein 18A-like protein n=1 Tax=Blastocystis sp. subtype 4 TaxID=944170 RepID=UPI0007113FC6|nr:autophagy-related protein 18A-like protein [Blastocystis sp. subtype 4]KNB44185.1 autophagy-related protein 18A-like protein [Blastocystis sp. subtype 4]|eukprot:XP_014527628.1 autophagy-related protein 18A-like protein [Blastocystis sp. subtype 4]